MDDVGHFQGLAPVCVDQLDAVVTPVASAPRGSFVA